MKKGSKISLNKRLSAISLAVLIPMLLVMVYLLMALISATAAYAEITESVTYANQYAKDFKERMDYSMYLAVIGKKDLQNLGDGETTVNGIATVNPYEYIKELSKACDKLSEMATVDSDRNQIKRLKNTLNALERCVTELEKGIEGEGTYQENMDYLDQNIYMLTALIQDGIQEYIHVETTNFENVRAELDAQNSRTFAGCLLISGIAIVLALGMTMQASRSVTRPIQKLCNLTQKVAEGDFTVKTKVDNIDEIAVLTQSFNDMTEEIGTLVEDIKQRQRDLHIAETRLMQAQINPHFLYNTLDTIVWLAEENRKKEVVSMVTALSDFFRTTLSKGQDCITVKEEASHIESYLKIQQFRYQDIMNYEIDIDEGLYEYVIPKLTLQPLVENALYHGIKNKRGGGTIRITGRKDGQKMIFQVIDNGKGMSEEVLNKLKDNLRQEKSDRNIDSFGLGNVNQRIIHYYGEGYGLEITSRENEGTEAIVTLAAKNNQPFV
ncbi:MAG: histidine kinase [Dorea sp.]